LDPIVGYNFSESILLAYHGAVAKSSQLIYDEHRSKYTLDFFYKVWLSRFNFLMKIFTLDLLRDRYLDWIQCKLISWIPVKAFFYWNIKSFLFLGFVESLFLDYPLTKLLHYYVWFDAKLKYKLSFFLEVYCWFIWNYVKLKFFIFLDFSSQIYSQFIIPFWSKQKTKSLVYVNDIIIFLSFSKFGLWLNHFFFF
jgi:hypothetical protein